MVVEFEMPWARGASADKDSTRQRVRAAFKAVACLGEWPSLAMIKQRIPDVSDRLIMVYRNELSRELGLAGKSGRVRVDLSLIS